MSLPKLLQDISEKYLDGRKDAFWQHKQSGQWLIKHRDLEIAAGRAGIRFDAPVILEAKAGESVAMVVTGRLTQWAEPAAEGMARVRLDDAVEWSIGEASPKNTTQAYPYAMAEKRAKDRVILKLFGIHGHAYSEEEAEDFKQSPRTQSSFEPKLDTTILAAYKMALEQASNLTELQDVFTQIFKNGHAVEELVTIKDIRKKELS